MNMQKSILLNYDPYRYQYQYLDYLNDDMIYKYLKNICVDKVCSSGAYFTSCIKMSGTYKQMTNTKKNCFHPVGQKALSLKICFL